MHLLVLGARVSAKHLKVGSIPTRCLWRCSSEDTEHRFTKPNAKVRILPVSLLKKEWKVARVVIGQFAKLRRCNSYGCPNHPPSVRRIVER